MERSLISITHRAKRLKIKYIRDDLWTCNEIEILKNNYEKIGPSGCVTLLQNRKSSDISKKALRLGLVYDIWSNEEIDVLRENYPSIGIKGCKKILKNKSESSIKHKAIRLGIKYNRCDIWSNEEIEILKIYYPKEGISILKRLPHRKVSSIHQKAASLKIYFNN